jgi:hypothetical protein
MSCQEPENKAKVQLRVLGVTFWLYFTCFFGDTKVSGGYISELSSLLRR